MSDHPIRVLVADDNVDFLENIREILEEEGYTVFVATDGMEAVRKAREHEVDLVVLDLKMPGKDGIEAFLEIQPLCPRSRGILMTAYPSETRMNDITEKIRILKKPFHFEDLLQLIELVATNDCADHGAEGKEGAAGRGGTTPTPHRHLTESPRILVIDDNRDYAENLREILEDQGWSCEIAVRGEIAKKMLVQRFYAAVLIDLALPDMEGLTLLEQIREHSPDTACLIITGQATVKTAISALNRGANAYITKDAPIEEILAYLQKALEKLSLTIENRRLHQELLASERKFRAIFDVAPIAITAFDRDGRVILWNPASERMFGFSAAEMEDSRISEKIVPPPHRHRFEGMIEAVFEGETFLNLEWIYRNSQGEDVETLICIIPVRDATGRIAFAIATALDITELKGLQQKIIDQESLARIGMMATTLAHEIKNPLAGIQGAIQLILKRVELEPTYRRMLGEIIEKIRLLTEIVGDLLAYARPATLRKQRVKISKLVDQVYILHENDPIFRDITLYVHHESPDSVCLLDPIQIQQVIANLCVNAAQAIDGEGKIWISTRLEAGKIVFSLADNGPGIPPENLDKLFLPFFTTRHHGTGLGLAICRKIIVAHDGEIEARNRPEGGGEFIFTIPCGLE